MMSYRTLGWSTCLHHSGSGHTSWTARFLGAKSQITDAAPGAVLFIVGLFTVFFTRYVLTVR